MPGIVGFCGKDINDQASLCKSMLSVITYRKDCKSFYKEAPSVSTGFVSLGVVGPKNQPYVPLDQKGWAFFDGEFYGVNSQDSALQDFYLAVVTNKNIYNFKGSFSAICVDIEGTKLYLISDKFGTKPIYYAHENNYFAFASEIKALLKLPFVTKKIDKRAFADFYHFGFVLGEKTLFETVKLLPPGSILQYDWQKNDFSIQKYWDLNSIFVESGRFYRDISLRDVANAFKRAVELRIESLSKIGISLSGGLDSRAILAALGGKAKHIHSYTLGLSGCADQRLAAEMSQLMGTKHDFLEINTEHLKDFASIASTLINLSDGLYHPHESTEKIALDYLVSAPFRILLRGHGGEIAKAALAYPVQVSPQMKHYKSMELIADYILQKANLGIQDVRLQALFTKEFAELVQEGPRCSLKESLSQVSKSLIPEDWCIFFYIYEWIRRQVVASLSIFRSQVEIRMPYLDEDFLKMLLQLPINMRYEGELQIAVVKYFAPALLKIPNSNTGAPLDASKWRLWIIEKWNSFLKRLSISGYRHYTEFERWQRRYFKEEIKQIIFDQRTLGRGIYNPDGLKEVFYAHVTNKKNYARLLGTIVGLELWYRNFVD